jgi:DHA1 family bicyclomycin/chloramphenicol resistance-like MFS transporter
MRRNLLTPHSKQPKPLAFVEFVILMALMIALVAFSIDAMLPALPEIGRELGVLEANDNSLIISYLFLGMAVGQIFYGPISDSAGRKPTIYVGFGIFMVGCVIALTATSFPMMLTGRLLQGLGVASPRSVGVALIRDQFEGRMMARVMSFVMAVFIFVPIIAPIIGQGILLVAGWRFIFVVYLIFATVMFLWFSIRQPETLLPPQRIPFTAKRIFGAFREVLSNRVALGFTVASGLISGAFLGYLNSAQPILQIEYGMGTRFPLIFGLIALSNGLASLINSQMVMRYGMRRLSNGATWALAGTSIIYFVFALTQAGLPPLWTFVVYFMVNFFMVGILFGNLNSLAMEPLGHVAGVGAAVVGSLASFISIPLGTWVAQAFDGTVLPLVGGYALLSMVSIGIMWWADAGKTVPQVAST